MAALEFWAEPGGHPKKMAALLCVAASGYRKKKNRRQVLGWDWRPSGEKNAGSLQQRGAGPTTALPLHFVPARVNNLFITSATTALPLHFVPARVNNLFITSAWKKRKRKNRTWVLVARISALPLGCAFKCVILRLRTRILETRYNYITTVPRLSLRFY
jgi:hypothetical protein